MATTVVSGSKDRQIPGIDGGTFTAASTNDHQIATKFHRVNTLIVKRIDNATQPTYVIFSGSSSAGAVVYGIANGGKYAWIAWGIGG